MEELKIGTTLSLTSGGSIEIKKKLGEGGQGCVYLVRDTQGQDWALKCYHNDMGAQFFDNLEHNASIKTLPKAFLWPKSVAVFQGERCGYIMPLAPDGYYDFGRKYLANSKGGNSPEAIFQSFAAKLQAAINICNGFYHLHMNGLSYQDVNPGAFLINPQTGDVKICDNDNVCPNNKSITGIIGLPRYIAAEVLNGSKPNINSDKMSLAILLYRLFMLDHPFEGKGTLQCPCLTADLEKAMYGDKAIFAHDRDNDKNRPHPTIHSNSTVFWPYCPDSLQKAFQKALSHDAITNPNSRMGDNEWKTLFLQLRRDLMVYQSNKADVDFLSDGITPANPRHLEAPEPHCRLSFKDGSEYFISKHKLLYLKDEMVPIASCVGRKKNDGTSEIALRNISNSKWNVKTASGKIHEIPNGEVLPLRKGMQVHFSGSDSCIIK